MTRPTKRTLSAAFLLVSLAFGATALGAEPSAADKETARGLMRQGDSALEKQDYDAALKAYKAADAIMHVPSTGIAVAKAQAGLGKLIEARDTALAVTRLPSAADEPEAFVQARDEARALAADLAKRIPSVKITVTGLPEGTPYHVKLGDTLIPPEGHALPRRVNPGAHVVTAWADGYAESKQEVTLAEGETKTVEMELSTGQRTGASGDVTLDSDGGGTSPLVYIGFGVGAAGLIAGSVTGFMSLSKASSAKENCEGNVCTPEAQDDIDSSKSLATISNIGFGVAIVGAAVGVYGLLTSGSSTPERAPAQRRVEPVVSHRFVGVAGTF